MGINIRSDEEIELIKISSLLVGKTIAEVAAHIKPGVTTQELDKIAEDYILSHQAKPAFKGYNGFPASLCISVNSEVVHGIPSKREIKEGDIISIDCGVLKSEYYGDSAYTFAVGEVDDDVLQLLRVTKECLYLGVDKAIAGNRVGDISNTIQKHAETHGYGVVRELIGHGVGRALHEKPEVPNFGKAGAGPLLKPGIVIAIEPMINKGTKNVRQLKDGWTIITNDGECSAHFEHTVAIGNLKPNVLSSFEPIEAAELKNVNLNKHITVKT